MSDTIAIEKNILCAIKLLLLKFLGKPPTLPAPLYCRDFFVRISFFWYSPFKRHSEDAPILADELVVQFVLSDCNGYALKPKLGVVLTMQPSEFIPWLHCA